jgi:outer membrane protein OmpA-like peptidoglycan-associated protein
MKHLLVIVLALFAALGITALQDPWDFVPGEKLLIYDDYTDMSPGGAPPHWKVRGSTLRLTDGRLLAAPGQTTTMWPNVVKWPNNFTIEMDILGKRAEDGERQVAWEFLKGDAWTWVAAIHLYNEGGCRVSIEIADPGDSQNVDCKYQQDKPNKYALWVQDGRIRIYLNGERLMDLNQVNAPFQTASLRIDNGQVPVSLGPFLIAESAPDVSKSLLASGRYTTHGIRFDTDSDVVKAESRPVLEQIAEALKSQPPVKVRIEGHTDSTGDPARNLDLSKRRAEAVKKALVTQFGVVADRLTTDGFGDTKPIAKNETPQGRAENRRVEFVKL